MSHYELCIHVHVCRKESFAILFLSQILMSVLMNAIDIVIILTEVYATTLLEASSVSVHLATLTAMDIDAYVS